MVDLARGRKCGLLKPLADLKGRPAPPSPPAPPDPATHCSSASAWPGELGPLGKPRGTPYVAGTEEAGRKGRAGVGALTDLSPHQTPTTTLAGRAQGGCRQGDRKPEQTPLPAVSSGIQMAAVREAPAPPRPQALGIKAPGGNHGGLLR